MKIQVTLFHTNDKPLRAGAQVELLGDGRVLATGTVDDKGAVSFNADPGGVQHLAVRLVQPAQK